eukprot:Rmarinus@m.19901
MKQCSSIGDLKAEAFVPQLARVRRGEKVERLTGALLLIDVTGYSRLLQTTKHPGSDLSSSIKSLMNTHFEMIDRHGGDIISHTCNSLLVHFSTQVSSNLPRRLPHLDHLSEPLHSPQIHLQPLRTPSPPHTSPLQISSPLPVGSSALRPPSPNKLDVDPVASASAQAVNCALALMRLLAQQHARLMGVEDRSVEWLGIRAAVSSGHFDCMYTSPGDFKEMVLSGAAVEQLQVIANCNIGQVVVSAPTRSLLMSFDPIISSTTSDGSANISGFVITPPTRLLVKPPLLPENELRRHLNPVELGVIDSPVESMTQGRMRTLTVCSIYLQDVSSNPTCGGKLSLIPERSEDSITPQGEFEGLHGRNQCNDSDSLEIETAQSRLWEIVYSRGGVVVDTLQIGTAIFVMCIWGLTGVDEPGAPLAVEAALRANGALRDLGGKASIGLATGQCWCGLAGGGSRYGYVIIGEALEASYRMMKAARGLVLCDDATRRATSEAARLENRPTEYMEFETKGIVDMSYDAGKEATQLKSMTQRNKCGSIIVYRPFLAENVSCLPGPEGEIRARELRIFKRLLLALVKGELHNRVKTDKPKPEQVSPEVREVEILTKSKLAASELYSAKSRRVSLEQVFGRHSISSRGSHMSNFSLYSASDGAMKSMSATLPTGMMFGPTTDTQLFASGEVFRVPEDPMAEADIPDGSLPTEAEINESILIQQCEKAGFVMFAGAPSSGKTWLLDAFASLSLSVLAREQLIYVSCQQGDACSPYSTFRLVLLGLMRSWVTEVKSVQEMISDAKLRSQVGLLEFLGCIPTSMLQVSAKDNTRLKAIDSSARILLLESICMSIVEWLVERRTYVLIFDNAQWMDWRSLDLLCRIHREFGCRILMVGAATIEKPPSTESEVASDAFPDAEMTLDPDKQNADPLSWDGMLPTLSGQELQSFLRLAVSADVEEESDADGDENASHADGIISALYAICPVIQLDPFTDREVKAILIKAVPMLENAAAIAGEIYSHTHGIPMFVSDVISTMRITPNILRKRSDGHVVLAIPVESLLTELHVSSSLEETMRTKLAKLSAAERFFVQVAAVLDRSFMPSILTSIAKHAMLEFADSVPSKLPVQSGVIRNMLKMRLYQFFDVVGARGNDEPPPEDVLYAMTSLFLRSEDYLAHTGIEIPSPGETDSSMDPPSHTPLFNSRALKNSSPGRPDVAHPEATKLSAPAVEPAFSFCSSAVRQSVLETIDDDTLQLLHRLVAEWYERAYSSSVNCFPRTLSLLANGPGTKLRCLLPAWSVLSYHWALAHNHAKALEYAEAAADRAMRLHAHRQARAFFMRALEYLDKTSTRDVDMARMNVAAAHREQSGILHKSHLHTALALTLQVSGTVHLAAKHYCTALSILGVQIPKQNEKLLLRCLMFREWSKVSFRLLLEALCWTPSPSEPTQRQKMVAEALEGLQATLLSLEVPIFRYAVLLLLNHTWPFRCLPEHGVGRAKLGAILFEDGWKNAGRNQIDEGLLMAKEAGASSSMLCYLQLLVGCLHTQEGHWGAAIRFFTEARRLAQDDGNVCGYEQTLRFQMWLCQLQGRFKDAISHAQQLLDSVRFSRNTVSGDFASLTLALSAITMGQPAEALSFLADVSLPLSITAPIRAWALLRQGNREEAIQLADAVLETYCRETPKLFLLYGYVGVAEVFTAACEENPRVEYHRKRVAHIVQGLKRYYRRFPVGEAAYLRYAASYQLIRGHQKRAIKMWCSSMASAQRRGQNYDAARAHLVLATHTVDPTRRREHLRKAAILFRPHRGGQEVRMMDASSTLNAVVPGAGSSIRFSSSALHASARRLRPVASGRGGGQFGTPEGPELASEPQNSEVRSIEALLPFVPRILMDIACRSEGLSMTVPHCEKLHGALLFVDISGFSRLGEELVQSAKGEAMERLSYMISECFEPMIRAIQSFAGDIIKFAGDALFVYFGGEDAMALRDQIETKVLTVEAEIEQARRQNILRACCAALACGQTLMTMNHQKLSVHCGLGAGDISALLVGGERGRNDVVVCGDALSQAVRSEARASAAEFVISPQALHLLLSDEKVSCTLKYTRLEPEQPSPQQTARPLPKKPEDEKGSQHDESRPSGDSASTATSLESDSEPKHREQAMLPPRTEEANVVSATEDDTFALVHAFENFDSYRRQYGVPRMHNPQNVATKIRGFVPAAAFSLLEGHVASVGMGELRQVTIMFVRLVGIEYTTEKVMNEVFRVDEAFKAIQRACYRFEGSLNRFQVDDKGTVFKIAFGLRPLFHRDDPYRGVMAAIDVHAALSDLELRCSVGVTTGYVFTGGVGALGLRCEYTTVGAVVTLAARLMQRADPILTDEATMLACKDLVRFEALDPVRLKGRAHRTKLFKPVVEEYRVRGTSSLQPASPAIIGREKGLRLDKFVAGHAQTNISFKHSMLDCLRQVMSHEGSRTILVLGSRGAGKTHMLKEFIDMARSFVVTVHCGRGEETRTNDLMHPVRPMLRQVFGLDDPTLSMAEREAAVLSRIDSRSQHLVALCNDVLPVFFMDDASVRSMAGLMRAHHRTRLFVSVIKSHIRGGAMVLALDNAHLLDAATWTFVNTLRLEMSNLLLVLTSVPQADRSNLPVFIRDAYGGESSRDVVSLRIRPLSSAEIRSAICASLHCTTADIQLVDNIHFRSRGNPQIAQEMALLLKAQGRIKSDKKKAFLLREDSGEVISEEKKSEGSPRPARTGKSFDGGSMRRLAPPGASPGRLRSATDDPNTYYIASMQKPTPEKPKSVRRLLSASLRRLASDGDERDSHPKSMLLKGGAVQATLEAASDRLAFLSPQEQRVLAACSTLGMSFPIKLLHIALPDINNEVLLSILVRLVLESCLLIYGSHIHPNFKLLAGNDILPLLSADFHAAGVNLSEQILSRAKLLGFAHVDIFRAAERLPNPHANRMHLAVAEALQRAPGQYLSEFVGMRGMRTEREPMSVDADDGTTNTNFTNPASSCMSCHVASLVARHLLCGGDSSRAVGFLERTGERALLCYSNTEALWMFDKAISVGGDVGWLRRAKWHANKGQACIELERRDEAEANLVECLRLLGMKLPDSRSFALKLSVFFRSYQLFLTGPNTTPATGLSPERQEAEYLRLAALRLLSSVAFQNQDPHVMALCALEGHSLACRIAPESSIAVVNLATASLLVGHMGYRRMADRFMSTALEAAHRHVDEAKLLEPESSKDTEGSKPRRQTLVTEAESRLLRSFTSSDLGRGVVVNGFMSVQSPFHTSSSLPEDPSPEANAEAVPNTLAGNLLDSVLALVHTLIMNAQRKAAFAKWDESEKAILEAKALSRSHNLQLQYEDAVLCYGTILQFKGEFEASMEGAEAVMASAFRRNDEQRAGWAMHVKAAYYFETDQAVEAASCAVGDFGSYVLAKAFYRTGDAARALPQAEKFLQCMMKRSVPVLFQALVALISVSEVVLGLWERDPRSDHLHSLSRQVLGLLTKTQDRFPVGEPAMLRFKGLYEWNRGKHSVAFWYWKKSIRVAEVLKMSYEAACTHLQVGRHMAAPKDRRHHLRAAHQVFSQCNATYQLRRVAEAGLNLEKSRLGTVKGTTGSIPKRKLTELGERSLFVGRAAELADLRRTLTSVLQQSKGRMVIIEGEPGVGKSRLLEEFMETAGEVARVSRCFGLEVEALTSYFCMRRILADIAVILNRGKGVPEAGTPAPLSNGSASSPRARVTTVLESVESGSGAKLQWIHASVPPEVQHLVPLMGDVLHTEVEQNEATATLEGEGRTLGIAKVFISLLQRVCKQGLFVLCMEDAQWLDSCSATVMTQIARHDIPKLMSVVTTRSLRVADPRCSWIRDLCAMPDIAHTRLARFDRNDLARLVCSRLQAKELPEHLVQVLYYKTQGNPLYADELAMSLLESGLLSVDPSGRCVESVELRMHGAQAVTFPQSIQSVVLARIDRLPPSLSLLLKTLAVFGPRAPLRMVLDLHPTKPTMSALVQDLVGLEQMDFILLEVGDSGDHGLEGVAATPNWMRWKEMKKSFSPLDCSRRLSTLYAHKLSLSDDISVDEDWTVSIKHSVTQDAAYNLTTFSQRKKLHRDAAAWYERCLPDLSASYALLCRHYVAAEDTSKAIRFLELAGERALENYSNLEALYFFQQLIQLGGGMVDRDRRALWDLNVAQACLGVGRLEDAEKHFFFCLKLLGRKVPAESSLTLRVYILVELLKHGALSLGGSALMRSLQSSSHIHLVKARAFQKLSEVFFYNFSIPRVAYCALAGLNLAKADRNSVEYVVGCANLGAVLSLQKHRRLGRRYHRVAIRVAEGGGMPQSALVHALMRQAWTYGLFAQWNEAKTTFERAADIASDLHDRRTVEECMMHLASLHLFQGRFRKAKEISSDVYELADLRDDMHIRQWSQIWGALCHLHADDPQAALDLQQGTSLTGILVLCHYRLHNDAEAFELAQQYLKDVTSRWHTLYTSFPAYCAVAEVAFSLWEAQPKDFAKKHLAQQSLAVIRKFRRICRTAAPALLLYEGWYAAVSRKPRNAAKKLWLRCIETADKLSMPYESGLAHYHIGLRAQSTQECRTHVGKAVDIFTHLGDCAFERRLCEAAYR